MTKRSWIGLLVAIAAISVIWRVQDSLGREEFLLILGAAVLFIIFKEDGKEGQIGSGYKVFIAGAATLIIVAILMGPSDRCVTGQQTRDGFECFEYESEIERR